MRDAMTVVALVLATASWGCEEPPRAAAPRPPERVPAESAIGEFEGVVAYYPEHVPDYGIATEEPRGPRAEATGVAYVVDIRPGLGAQLATLALRVGDERITTEVILLPRARRVELQATRPVRCGAVETGGGTQGYVDGDELVVEQLRLEEACTLGAAEARYWQFEGRRAPSP